MPKTIAQVWACCSDTRRVLYAPRRWKRAELTPLSPLVLTRLRPQRRQPGGGSHAHSALGAAYHSLQARVRVRVALRAKADNKIHYGCRRRAGNKIVPAYNFLPSPLQQLALATALSHCAATARCAVRRRRCLQRCASAAARHPDSRHYAFHAAAASL
jgi:hypothetical protein